MLPGQPSSVRATPPERLWWWSLEESSGAHLAIEGHDNQRFATQADAESWVGETWVELAAHGVAAVTLHEGDRVVYGPMSLSA